MTPTRDGELVLLTGATGFVGSRLLPELRRRGVRVRAGTRRPAGPLAPGDAGVEVARCDLDDPGSLRDALAGCDAAYYLVHAMSAGHGYAERELRQARDFAAAAQAGGVKRIVYLGGPAPGGVVSPHLRSRIAVGEALRASAVPTLELRASMIVGHGSTSWQIVRDLSARLPFMILPSWTGSRTQPVAVDDVVEALACGLRVDLPASRACDLPGPEVLSVREIFTRVAGARGRRPRTMRVPLLSPGLSALWLRFVSGAPTSVAEELVLGLERDILMSSTSYWAEIGRAPLISFDEAVARALAEESRGPPRGLAVRALERLAGALSARPR